MGKTNNKQKFLGGKNVMKKYSTLKRLAAGAISAMMVFTSISAVFAAETTTTAQTITVESERKLIGEVKGSTGTFENDLYKTVNYSQSGVTIGTDPEQTVTLENHTNYINPTFRNKDLETVKAAMKDYDKYIYNFDVWATSTNTGHSAGFASMLFRGDQIDEKDNNIFIMKLWDDHMKFENAGCDKNFDDKRWYNIKIVVYLPEDGKDNPGSKIQTYVDDRLIGEAITTKALDKLIPQHCHLQGGTETKLKIKNIKLYLAKDAEVSVDQAVYKEESVDKIDKESFAESTFINATNIFRRPDTTNTDVTEDGFRFILSNEEDGKIKESTFVAMNDESVIMNYFKGSEKHLYKDYTLSFDAKIPTTEAQDNQLLQKIGFLTPMENKHQYFGFIQFYPNFINFSNGLNGASKNVDITSDNVHIDMRVKPSIDKTVAPHVTWYLNGKNVFEGDLNIKQENTSLNGFIKCVYGYSAKDSQHNKDACVTFNNLKLSVTKKSAHPDKAFNASVTKSGNSLNVAFDKEIANANYITNNSVVVKADGKTAVTATEVTYDVDTKTATIKLPENSNADWYSVELTDVLTSTDGVYLTNNIVSTPHFAVDSAKIDVDSEGNNKLNITYTNTLDEKQNVMVMLAAYDTDGRLVKVDVKSYGVNASGTVTPDGEEVPTISTTEGNLTVRGYIWGANNCPIYNVVTLSEVE